MVISLLADALVILGVFIMTIGVLGMLRMPDTYTKTHAASKAVFLGVISLLVASAASGQIDVILRVILIIVALILTTPVASHVIARAAYDRGEIMSSPDPVDESGAELHKAKTSE
jgi:multicomponent Na+:H+ antiporter subunit G